MSPTRRRPNRSGVFAALLALPLLAGAADPTILLRVDPEAGPLRSLDAALGVAAARRAEDPARPIRIELAPALYRLAQPVLIGETRGGSAGAPLVIRGAPGGRSILTGSVPLVPVEEPLPEAITARLPTAARAHVRLYRLPPEALESPAAERLSLLRDRPASMPLEVYDGEGALHPARWPNEGWAAETEAVAPPAPPRVTLPGAPLDRLAGEPDLWVEGYFRFDWLFEAVPAAPVDPASAGIALAIPPDEGVIRPKARLRVTHALSQLDAPGEWWRDRDHGWLVAWPRDPSGRLEVAVTDTLLRIADSGHIRLENLAFEHARGDAVVVHDSRDVRISETTVAWTAGRGIVFDNATDSGLDSGRITDTGGTGVRLIGGDRDTLRPSGLFVRRSRFARYGRLILTQQAGVQIDGVGVEVADNLFEDAGAAGVAIHGNEHRVTGNVFTRLLMGTTDSGAIYAGRDWTSRGTVIARNLLHDIGADPGFENKGIYLDDEASGFTLRDNVFLRVQQPVFIGGGRDNRVEGNLFIASSPAIHVDSRGETWAGQAMDDPGSELRVAYGAVPVGSPLWRSRYPGLATILSDEPKVAKNNILAGNSFVLSDAFDVSDGGDRGRQVIAGTHGPDGIRLWSGDDLARVAAESRDPHDFVGLRDAGGRPLGQAANRRFGPGDLRDRAAP